MCETNKRKNRMRPNGSNVKYLFKINLTPTFFFPLYLKFFFVEI